MFSPQTIVIIKSLSATDILGPSAMLLACAAPSTTVHIHPARGDQPQLCHFCFCCVHPKITHFRPRNRLEAPPSSLDGPQSHLSTINIID